MGIVKVSLEILGIGIGVEKVVLLRSGVEVQGDIVKHIYLKTLMLRLLQRHLFLLFQKLGGPGPPLAPLNTSLLETATHKKRWRPTTTAKIYGISSSSQTNPSCYRQVGSGRPLYVHPLRDLLFLLMHGSFNNTW